MDLESPQGHTFGYICGRVSGNVRLIREDLPWIWAVSPYGMWPQTEERELNKDILSPHTMCVVTSHLTSCFSIMRWAKMNPFSSSCFCLAIWLWSQGGKTENWYWQWHCCWEKPEYIFTDLCVAAFWNKNGNACSCGLKKLPSATGRAPGPLLKCQEGTQILPETGLETARFTASCSCYRAVLPWWIVSCLKHEHK